MLPKTGIYAGLDLSKPFYPETHPIKRDNVPIKKGIKNGDDYMLLQCVSKHRENYGDLCFLATNGKKLLYIRHNEATYKNRAGGILASKIAKFVSPKHFSSERLLTHGGVGARKLDGYAIPLTDYSVRKKITSHYEQQKKIIPGTGIVDKVCSFIGEQDYNVENLGLSKENLDMAYLSKIDFDHCFPEQLGNTIVLKAVYEDDNSIKNNEDYITEELYASLKLSLLTIPLLSEIANKAYTIQEEKKRQEVINVCFKKSNSELDFF
jgi:hypothetical protein